MIGLSFLVVLMVSIPLVIKKMKSKQSTPTSSSGDLLDLSYEERWDLINKKEEEVKKIGEEKIAQIESKLIKKEEEIKKMGEETIAQIESKLDEIID